MIRDSLTILAITSVILISAEFSLRLIFPGKILEKINVADLAYTHDPDVIISLKPNITKEFKNSDINGGEVITWKTNSLGYRGEEIDDNAKYRILVYGDSNIQARFSRFEDTFSQKLKYFLNKEKNNVEVINAGLVGAGPDQSLLRFIGDANVIKPDMMILHLFADNDYGDIIRNRLFELDADEQLVRTSFVIKQDQQITESETGLLDYLRSLLLTRSAVKLFTKDESALSRDEKIEAAIEKMEGEDEQEYMNYKSGEERISSHFADHYDIDIATRPDSDAARIKKLLMHKVLGKLKVETDNKNVHLLVVVLPAVADVLTDNTILARNDLSKYKKYNYRNLTDPINIICNTLELHCVHLMESFLDNNPHTLYLKEDNHWSDEGQALSASIVSKYILDNFTIE